MRQHAMQAELEQRAEREKLFSAVHKTSKGAEKKNAHMARKKGEKNLAWHQKYEEAHSELPQGIGRLINIG